MKQLLKTTKEEQEKEKVVRILKSWTKLGSVIKKQDTRRISLSTLDIINRKDTSKNPLIYQSLDKLTLDYQKYKDNFPQDYYVELGKYMVESAISQNKNENLINILSSLIICCKLITESLLFGNKEYFNGGIAIFHLYESYVPRFDGDANGLDKVSHFLFGAFGAFVANDAISRKIGIGNEMVDSLLLEAKTLLSEYGIKFEDYGTGFDEEDIEANEGGIKYGNELRMRYKGAKQ
ncbi:hypothetical protein [Helicobacter sp. MIT 05-5294]|uniref:hypothetical protein n=1 Tax=Helicobacter sp. MIT 05-5294 TaxID=1548150 RepID=UPI000AA808D3|nr:hypothetical protein [Helicobacter sp. MIT 05-5294]TLD85479.1 hypothetical protein LS69_009270 [Helicobacter sp. MIT 05-5294]